MHAHSNKNDDVFTHHRVDAEINIDVDIYITCTFLVL